MDDSVHLKGTPDGIRAPGSTHFPSDVGASKPAPPPNATERPIVARTTTTAEDAAREQARAAESLIVVTTTTATEDAARELASAIVQQRWAACAQVVGPITSVYRWDGTVQTDQEWRVELKTRASLLPAIEAHLARWHDYDVPELVATPIVDGSAAYLRWIVDETGVQ